MNGATAEGGALMFDKDLARRFLMKINKEVVNAFILAEKDEQRFELQKAINDITLMYDILHLNDIQMIDIGNSNK